MQGRVEGNERLPLTEVLPTPSQTPAYEAPAGAQPASALAAGVRGAAAAALAVHAAALPPAPPGWRAAPRRVSRCVMMDATFQTFKGLKAAGRRGSECYGQGEPRLWMRKKKYIVGS